MAPPDDQLLVLLGLAAVVLVLVLIVRGLIRGKPEPLPAQGPLRMLVRPLKELRPDPNHIYLGMTISRNIVQGLKSYERLEPSLGDALCNLSIEGTVQKTGPRLVINVKLLSGGRHTIWSGTYDTAINDLARSENEIVQNVVRSLRLAKRKTEQAASNG